MLDEKERQKHRIIGIRYTLKPLKQKGLVEDDTMYPNEAVEEVQDEMLRLAQRWYRIGARRGTTEFLDALLQGDFYVREDNDGNLEVIAKKKQISWERGLRVRVGQKRKRISKRRYIIRIEDLGFE